MSMINPASRADGTTVFSEGERPLTGAPGKTGGATHTKTPGIDDGWDSASSTSWATDLVEPNEEARRHAWRDHQDQDERAVMHRELARDAGQAEAPADSDSRGAKELTGEVALAKDPLQEAQNKLGLRSLRQADTALEYQVRSTQAAPVRGTPDRVDSISASTNSGADEQPGQRQRDYKP